MSNDFQNNSRSGYRAKRKKTNLVLNSLIIIVLLLIIVVAYNIFASGNDDAAAPKQETPKTEQKQEVEKENKEEQASTEEEETTEDPDIEGEEESEEAAATEQADESQAVVSEGGSSSNVIRTIENPSWQPVGTTQTGEHTAVYDESSVDWQEMLNAVTYATGLEQSNMTVYWLGRDRSTAGGSFATVASKDNQQKYNVYIQWVDGEGWMPTKVEELSEIKR